MIRKEKETKPRFRITHGKVSLVPNGPPPRKPKMPEPTNPRRGIKTRRPTVSPKTSRIPRWKIQSEPFGAMAPQQESEHDSDYDPALAGKIVAP